MKSIKNVLLAGLLIAPAAAAQTTVNPGPSTDAYVGFMNVFELDCSTFAFGGAWGVPDLSSSFDDGVGTITLGAAPIVTGDAFWYVDGVGGTGSAGNKCMEANLYNEITDDSVAGQTLTFEGTVNSNTWASGYSTVAFIRDFAGDFSTFTENTVALTTGNFSVSLALDPGLGRVIQYGFRTNGPNVWPGDEPLAGSLVIAQGPPVPTGPANDDCSSAASVAVGSNPYDGQMATTDGTVIDTMVCDFGFGANDVNQDVWFSFTAPSTDLFDIEVTNNGNGTYDSRLAIYDQSSCPDDPNLVIDCDDDDGAGLMSKLESVALTGGSTYLIRCGTFGPTSSIVPADLVISVVPAPPVLPNDDCGNAVSVSVGSNPYDPTLATDDGVDLDPMVCDLGFGNNSIFNDVWFTFTAGDTGTYDIEITANSGYDSRIAAYSSTGCPDDPATVVACDDDGGSGSLSLISGLALSSGDSILIRCGTFSAFTSQSPSDLMITFMPPPPAANDDCGNAAPVTVGINPFVGTPATTDGIDLDPMVCDLGFGNNTIHQDVWFSFTAPTTENYSFEVTANVTYDGRMAVYNQASCPDDPALVLDCNDDDGAGLLPLISGISLTSGSTYLVRVGTFGATSTINPAELVITALGAPPVPPANDDCANAAVVGEGLTAFDTSLATTDGLELDPLVCELSSFGSNQIFNDVWYCFTAPATKSYDVTTFNLAGFDTRLAVYEGCGSNDPALVIACNDDFAGAPFEAGLSFNATAGNSYKIRLGGFDSGTSGAGELLIQGAPSFSSFCFGDGLGRACKCGNDDVLNPGTGGCLNSAGTGAVLATNGDASVTSNSLTFDLTGGVPTALAVLTSGDNALGGGIGILGLPESDGLRCVGGSLLRHGSRGLDGSGANGASWGAALTGPPGGIIGGAGFVAGQTRYFQVRNRDLSTAGCMFGTNTSQAISITFEP